ncbi:MAG TPA: hypothetical protein VML55_25285 [Planctomycetaceae bacterium]|nr:hypothetical protein [Planctomycetaceae bacterium]
MGTVDLSPLPAAALLPSGFPRRVMRRLIVGSGLGVGSRVLLAGRGAAALLPFFEGLGLAATGCDDDDAEAAAHQAAAANGELPAGRFAARSAHDEPAWDLVLGIELSAWDGSLFAGRALHATANLLSCTRPDGRAVLLVRFGEGGCAAGGHTASCFVRHLSHFRGDLDVCDFPEGLARVDRFAWIVGRRPRPGCLLAGLRVPAVPPSPFGWHEQAEAAVRHENCCRLSHWATQQSAA